MKRIIAILALLPLIIGGAEARQKSDVVSVISYNIRLDTSSDGVHRWDNRKEGTIAMFERTNPDLVGMQEVLPNQMDYIQNNLEGYSFLGVGRDDGKRKGEIMTIAYRTERFEMLDNGNFWLSETPDKVSRGWDGACNRMVTWVRLKEKETGKIISFFNTHLDHIGVKARKEGVRLLIDKVKQIAGRGDNVIITGDFNMQPNNPNLRPMFRRFNNARYEARISDPYGTFNDWGEAIPQKIIDYIFTRKARPVIYKTIIESYGVGYLSDHYPISSIIKLK